MNEVDKLFSYWKAGVVSRYWLCDSFLSAVKPDEVETSMTKFPRECLDLLRELATNEPGLDSVNIGVPHGETRRKETLTAIRKWFDRQ